MARSVVSIKDGADHARRPPLMLTPRAQLIGPPVNMWRRSWPLG